MSEPNRAQLMNIYGDVYHHFLTQIATDRKIDTATLNNAINNLQGWLPEEAKDLKLIDQTAYYDEVLAAMKEKVGIAKKEDLKLVEVAKYVTTLEKNVESGNKIAVVYAEGEIVGGDGDDGQIGGEKYAKLIRKLRLDDKVKAIVLRVNSPGGSALASDVMWRELVLAKKDKPLVVSFGDVAASGGYFIACMGDRIFAQPNTITGSIGVFGLIPNAKKLLNDKLGITTDKVQVTEHGAMSLGTNPLNEAEKAVIQRSIEKTYREFKLRVAEGRQLDTAYIETIAQGHVWTGNQGIENKLVDEIGGLDAAIKYAATKANLKDFRTKSYPEEKDWKAQLTESLGDAKASIIKSEIGEEQYKIYKTIKNITHTTGIQMRMPMEFDL
jgi:protease-4